MIEMTCTEMRFGKLSLGVVLQVLAIMRLGIAPVCQASPFLTVLQVLAIMRLVIATAYQVSPFLMVLQVLAVMRLVIATDLHTFIFFLQRPQAFQIQMRFQTFLPIA